MLGREHTGGEKGPPAPASRGPASGRAKTRTRGGGRDGYGGEGRKAKKEPRENEKMAVLGEYALGHARDAKGWVPRGLLRKQGMVLGELDGGQVARQGEPRVTDGRDGMGDRRAPRLAVQRRAVGHLSGSAAQCSASRCRYERCSLPTPIQHDPSIHAHVPCGGPPAGERLGECRWAPVGEGRALRKAHVSERACQG